MKDSYRFGHCELHPVRRRLLVSGKRADLGQRAFDVLLALVERAGDLVTKDELLARAWPNLVVEENNLSQQVSALRKLIGAEAIATVPSVGYRFTIPLTSDARSLEAAAPSIAVLPFEDMSAERNQEFFADGLAEEILNALARMRSLRVISRTSAFSFKGQGRNARDIAARLGVVWILEGSVRRSGSRIRVTSQLVRAADDAPVWSQTYDRELADLFAVQDEIARAVVKEIQPSLFASEDAASGNGRARDVEAHRLYLLGKFLADKSTRIDVQKGIEYLTSAVERDPALAMAWACLARAHATRASFGWEPYKAEFERAEKAARTAIEIEPKLAEGHSALAWVLFSYRWDWAAAQVSIQRALELAPGNAEIVREAAFQEGCAGRFVRSVALARQAVELDPLSLRALRTLGLRCMDADLLEEAEEAMRTAIELFPAAGRTRYHLGRVLLLQGRLEEALAAFESEPEEQVRGAGIPLALHALGRSADARARLEEFAERHAQDSGVQIAEGFAFLGDPDGAFEWMGRSLEQRDAGISALPSNPFLRNLHSDARWRPFLAKVDLP